MCAGRHIQADEEGYQEQVASTLPHNKLPLDALSSGHHSQPQEVSHDRTAKEVSQRLQVRLSTLPCKQLLQCHLAVCEWVHDDDYLLCTALKECMLLYRLHCNYAPTKAVLACCHHRCDLQALYLYCMRSGHVCQSFTTLLIESCRHRLCHSN